MLFKINLTQLQVLRVVDPLLKCSTIWRTWISLSKPLKKIYQISSPRTWRTLIACPQHLLQFLKRLKIKWRHLLKAKKLRLRCPILAQISPKCLVLLTLTIVRAWVSPPQAQQTPESKGQTLELRLTDRQLVAPTFSTQVITKLTSKPSARLWTMGRAIIRCPITLVVPCLTTASRVTLCLTSSNSARPKR